MLLGCIADDFTGATDLANTLVREGMRTVQTIGVPGPEAPIGDVDAVVVALKTRTVPAADAVEQSLAALRWLRGAGARQIFFKVCSTFDSTDQGNIGPVADALMDALEVDFTLACPAFPTNGRTVYKGHLFVGDLLLSQSAMKDHPLTPMTDSDLVRILGRQSRRKVGLIDHGTVAAGAQSIGRCMARLRSEGCGHAIVDAISDDDLRTIGKAAADLALVTGGSGVALGLPENFRRRGLLGAKARARAPAIVGATAVLAGSCSERTRQQVAAVRRRWPAHALDPAALMNSPDPGAEAVAWAEGHLGKQPVVIYSTNDPASVAAVQDDLGRERAAEVVERAFGRIAAGLVDLGVRRFIVAGGETSGAVVRALGITALRIGPEIDPGVPWTESVDGPRVHAPRVQAPRLALALKSGNFGAVDFFDKALGMLP